MKRQHVKIDVNAAGRGTIELDGVPLNARSVEVCAGVGMSTSVKVDLVNVDLEADFDYDVDEEE